MGNLLGRADLRVHDGRLQYSADGGVTWLDPIGIGQPRPAAALLPDADLTIAPDTDKASLYILPAGRLTSNRVLTVDNAGGTASAAMYVAVFDLSAFTYTIRNSTPATAFTKGASPGQAKMYSLFHSAGAWIANIAYWI